MYVKERGRITNKEYQGICNIKKRLATDDLKELEKIEIFKRIGTTGKGTYYILKGHQRGRNRVLPTNCLKEKILCPNPQWITHDLTKRRLKNC